MIRCTGEGGADLSFTEPLPAVIQSQIDRGLLKVVSSEPDSVPESRQEPPPAASKPMPAPEASSAAWHEYALGQGMPAGKCHNMNKAQLIQHYRGLRAVS